MLSTENPFEIPFIDGLLPDFAEQVGIEIENFYDFSIRYGTSALVNGVNNLISNNGYDLVVAVDMGGDVLARGGQDPTLLSPMMDFTSLYLLGQLEVDSFLEEFGLGTDGELRPLGMAEIMQELNDNNLILSRFELSNDLPEVVRFRELFGLIKEIRPGYATIKTLETLGENEDLVARYRLRSQIGEKKYTTWRNLVLPSQYFRKAYLIDSKGLAERRKNTAFPYQNPLEQYVRLKQVPSWKTELDLLCLWSGDDWTTPRQKGYCMLLLAPSYQIPKENRREIILEGLSLLNKGNCDLALILKEDLDYVSSGEVLIAGEFALVSQKEGLTNFLEKTAEEIERYQI